VGEAVTVTGSYCGTGATVTAITRFFRGEYAKGPTMSFPLDTSAVGLVQSAGGFTFQYTHPTDREYVWFETTCSTGTTASSEPTKVTVWPDADHLWFRSVNGLIGAAPGDTTEVVAASLDCLEGSTGDVAVSGRGRTVATANATVVTHVMTFSVTVDLAAASGDGYVATVHCTRAGGGQVTDTHAFGVYPGSVTSTTVAGDGGTLPPSGGRIALLWIGVAVLALGMSLRSIAAARTP
jgi:hypothetical protein